jgi:dolichol-phosphate mannosyltransferase
LLFTKNDEVNKSIVIIPTYKEKENIESIIRYVFKLPVDFHILIIDDNSPDGTAAIVKTLITEFTGKLHIIERPGKLGLGTAYIRGFQWALENGYDYIFEMDADFSHNPDDLIRLREAAINGADLVIGSRYVSGINVVNWPLRRVLMSYFASKYVRIVTGMKVHDATAGFVCYSANVLNSIDLNNIRMKGYGFQIEMKFTAWKHGFKVIEIPIIFIDRQKGTSKMSGGIFSEAFFGVIKLKWRSLFKKI